jgi:4-amino-4-deoxy-L-arabinose transferase-like glycosyltransferase
VSLALSQSGTLQLPAFPALRVSSETFRILLLAAICCLPILFFLPFLTAPFMRDEAFYASVAQAMRHGAMPYAYGFDNKPPMIFYWYYLSFGLFGENVWAPRLLACLLLSAGSGLIYAQGRLMFTRNWGLVAALVFGLSTGVAQFEIDANTEYFLIPLAILALLAFTLAERLGGWYWYVVCGAASAVAIMTKQTAVFSPVIFAAFTLYPLAQRRSLRGSRAVWEKLALLCAGGAAGLVTILLPFALTGTLGEFYRSAVVYAGQYTQDVTLMQRLSLIVNQPPGQLAVNVGVLLGGVSLAFVLRKPNRDSLLLMAWFLAAVAGVVVAGRFYMHYFVMLLPGMALLALPALQWVKANWPGVRAGALVLGLLLLCLHLAFTNAQIYLQPTPTARHLAQYPGNAMASWEAQSEEVGKWINGLTRPGEKIYEFGFMPGVYFYSGRESPTQYIFKHPFAINEAYARDAVRQMEADKPVLIFDSAAYELDGEFAYHGETILSFMRENYTPLGKYYFGDLWVLKGWQPAKPIGAPDPAYTATSYPVGALEAGPMSLGWGMTPP